MTLFENIGFFVINFILFIAFAYIISITTEKGYSKLAVYTISSIIYTLLLLSVKVSMSNKDNFTFEVSPSKKCCNNYLAGPDCARFYNTEEGIQELHATCCGGGFSGRPVHYEFTPESDQNWENKRCNPKPTGFLPAVL
jgi:hypothetical protein